MKNIYKCDGATSWFLPKEEIKCDNLMYLRDIYNNIGNINSKIIILVI